VLFVGAAGRLRLVWQGGHRLNASLDHLKRASANTIRKPGAILVRLARAALLWLCTPLPLLHLSAIFLLGISW
jgi:hypothetical protein